MNSSRSRLESWKRPEQNGQSCCSRLRAKIVLNIRDIDRPPLSLPKSTYSPCRKSSKKGSDTRNERKRIDRKAIQPSCYRDGTQEDRERQETGPSHARTIRAAPHGGVSQPAEPVRYRSASPCTLVRARGEEALNGRDRVARRDGFLHDHRRLVRRHGVRWSRNLIACSLRLIYWRHRRRDRRR